MSTKLLTEMTDAEKKKVTCVSCNDVTKNMAETACPAAIKSNDAICVDCCSESGGCGVC